MNEFQKRFENFDNRKLLKILEDADNYQSLAVEAAKLELSKREVSEDEIQLIKDEITDRQAKIEKRQEQVKKVENKAKAISTEIFETVSPIQKEPQTIDRKINLIVIVFGLLATYQIFKELEMMQFIFSESITEWDFSLISYFLPIIFLPIGVFYFWKRNKAGWILMSAFFVYNIVNAIGMFFLTWEWKDDKGDFRSDYSEGELQLEIHDVNFDHLFPLPNPIIYVLIIAIFGATLWTICKEDIRNEFQVNLKSTLVTIGISIIITSTIFGLI